MNKTSKNRKKYKLINSEMEFQVVRIVENNQIQKNNK